MTSTHEVDGHILTLLRNGEEYFPRLIVALENATQLIYLETYIFEADATGRMVATALAQAAQRGVQTHLLLDGFGSASLPKAWLDELRAAGVQVLKFRPQISWLTLQRQRLRRLHRKVALIDGRVAFIGGINIINDIPGGAIVAPRLDYAVEVRGPVIEDIYAITRQLWTLVAWTNFRRQRLHVSLKKTPGATQRKVALLVRDNLRHRRDIEQAYLSAISAAQQEIIIANAYFMPGTHLRHALLHAVRRGVKVVLLLQGRVEYHLQHYATLALYDELLLGGVQIYEYYASFMHAKVAVVDSYWSTVGSSNIDPFSLWLAREANLVIYDREFALTLRADVLQQMESGAHPVAHADWRRHNFLRRWLARASYAVVRFLAATVGYGQKYDM
ncbi:MAG: cardiolipin synthase ClsB [Pseudomonadota bacterium]